MNIEIIRRAYDAIGEKTPLQNDCGSLCSAACCFAAGVISVIRSRKLAAYNASLQENAA